MTGFRSYVWDPVLLTSQIITMQCLFYVGLGCWVICIDFIMGNYRSLDQIFSYEELHFRVDGGKLVMIAYVLNALTGAFLLWNVVKRTKQCLDFTCTAHGFHVIICWIYNSSFPSTLSWWLTNIVSTAIMTVSGEFLCMRTELQAIPLSMGPKADL